MAFTNDVTTELRLGDEWVDVSADMRYADGVTISRGRADEASTPDASSCTLTLDNRSGDYSPRNPNSPYFGILGRNTPIRVRTPSTLDNCLVLSGGVRTGNGGESGFVSTPSDASLDIVGDIDIRVDVEPQSWRPSTGYGLAQKAVALEPTLRSWRFWLDADGFLNFRWSPDVGISADVTVTSTVAVGAGSGRLAVRVTLDVDNGAGGNTARFYTSPSIAGTYTQLGADVVTSGVTVIDATDSPLDVGRVGLTWNNTYDPDVLLQGKVYAVRIRSGIGGTLVASPDFDTMDSGDTSLTDLQGRVWSLAGRALVANPSARFHGEVSSWPVRWDKPGVDLNVPVQAYGIMRRLGQGQATRRSSMYRFLVAQKGQGLVQYWPCEDGDDATQLASALPNRAPMFQYGGAPSNSSFDGFECSDALPTPGTTHWIGKVASYTDTGLVRVEFLMALPAGGVAANAGLLRVRTTGGDGNGVGRYAPRWDIDVTTAGSVQLRVYNHDDVEVGTSGNLAWGLNGKLVRVILLIDDASSADINYYLTTREVGAVAETNGFGDTLSNRTLGRVLRIGVGLGTFSGGLGDTAIGHISVHNDNPILTDPVQAPLDAYAGELATSRMLRLCQEEDVPIMIEGDSLDATRLGPEHPATMLELLNEAAFADLGVLYEPREALGLAYRTRASFYSQAPALTLDYAARTLSAIEPVEDDDSTRNDVTVTNVDGSSTRAELTEGPLSVNPPPDGVGRYEDNVAVSLHNDAATSDQAWWRLHLGTVDEPRYPVLGMDLAMSAFTTGTALVLNGTSPGRASTPDTAALDITGDIDIRAHAAMDDWTPDAISCIVGKWQAAGTRSYMLDVLTSGRLRMLWSVDGSAILSASSTVSPTVSDGAALWVRATLDVDNGAAGRTVTFYTSTDGATWTPLGTPVTTAGVTSVFSGTAEVAVGANTGGTTNRLAGKVSTIEIRNGIDGTVVADPVFSAQDAGTASFADSTGKTWTITTPATIGTDPGGMFSTLSAAAERLAIGDKLVVSNPPSWLPPEDITQIVQGFTETLTPTNWVIDANCAPASPWDVGVWDASSGAGEARYSTDGTVLAAGTGLLLNGVSPGRASTPDTAALDITGDIEIRVHALLDDWTPATNQTLVSKWVDSGSSNRSYRLRVDTTGVLRLLWSNDGVAVLSAPSTVAPTVVDGEPLWVRADLDVDNGAAGRTVTFYTSPDGSSWVQLGSPVVQAGVTSIFSGTAPMNAGAFNDGTSDRLAGRVFAARVRNGIGGTYVADATFGDQPAGTTSFTDDAGRVWTITAPAVIDGGVIVVDTPTGPSLLTAIAGLGTSPVWGAADLPYDLMVGGERVTVTGVAGAARLQALTVTRAVNGVVKTHVAGSEVVLFKPGVYGL